ncbi:MAG: YdcF family protein [Brumimicrobium sp.]
MKKWAKWATVVILLFFSNTFIFKEFIRMWEIPAVAANKIEHHEVGIVLGGMFEYDNDTERLTIRRGGDRIWQAIDLYKKGKIEKILISGDHGYVSYRGLNESKQLKELLVSWGIPSEDLIIETTSQNTYQNAKETAKLLKDEHPQYTSFLLITSASHMRRARGCFENQGLKVTPFSTDPFVGESRSYYWDEFIIPNGFNFGFWFVLNKEVVGYIAYDVTGYI